MKQDCLAREMSREIIVGAFMIMIFLGLGYFTIILSQETWFRPKTRMSAVFSDVMGLREGDSVVVRGMPVGKVRTLSLEPDGVHVLLSLEKPLHMRTDYRITVMPTSMLGGRMLQVHEGSTEHPELPPEALLVGVPPNDIIADASDLVSAVKKGLVDGQIIENLRDASVQIREIATRLNSGQGALGKLLSADDTLYKDLAGSAESLRQIVDRVEKGQGTMGKLLSADDTLYKDLSSTVASLRSVSERLEKGEGTLGKLMSSDNKLYDDLSASVASLRSVADNMEKGHGTVGRMMKDDSLYIEIEETIIELRATIDDFRETSPLTTFTSVLFGSF